MSEEVRRLMTKPVEQQVTEIIAVMDRSGSMQSIEEETVKSFNDFIEEQKKGVGKALLTLALFNHDYELMYNGKPLDEVEPLTHKKYAPGGTTALRDAIGMAVSDVDRRLSETEVGKHPDKFIVLVITDGFENASKEYSSEDIRKLIADHEAKDEWEFSFLGANQDAVLSGGSMNFAAASSYNIAASPQGIRDAYTGAAAMTMSYRAMSDLSDKHMTKSLIRESFFDAVGSSDDANNTDDSTTGGSPGD